MTHRRTFTAEFKTQVVLDLVSGVHSAAELCRQYQLNPQGLARWKTEFLERAPLVFEQDQRRSAEQEWIADEPCLRLERDYLRLRNQLRTRSLFKNTKIKMIVSIFFVLAIILLSIHIVQELSNPSQKVVLSPNAIQIENAKPGTIGWSMTKQAYGQIQAYTDEPSINKGGDVHLYVSTFSPSYSIDIYRLGYYHDVGARLVESIPASPGVPQGYYPGIGPNPVECRTCITSLLDSRGLETDISDANWKLTNIIHFPSNWVSGIYYIKVTENRRGYQWAVPVVLRDDNRQADLIFEDPVNTDQAYNYWGGTGLYNDFRHPGVRNGHPSYAYYASFDRPYRQGEGVGFLFSWTYSMLRFMEKNGYDVTYTTNDAISESYTNLLNYRGFVAGGHDEYWDNIERQKLELAISRGRSVAFFTSNAMYWQIRYTTVPGTNHKAIICYRFTGLDPYSTDKNLEYLTTTKWRNYPLNDPEDRVLKAMFISQNINKIQDFVAEDTNNWIYFGTNMRNGDIINRVVGLEIDTTFSDGSITPNDRVTIIGDSPYVDQDGKHWRATAVIDEPVKGNNIIFDAGSYVWPDALSDFRVPWPVDKDGPVAESSILEQMTNNILQRMIKGALI